MDQQQFKHLIEKYLQGSASEEDIAIIYQWYDSFDDSVVLVDDDEARLRARLFNKITPHARIATEPSSIIPLKKRTENYVWYAAAAILLFMLGTMAVLKFSSQKLNDAELAKAIRFKPGASLATLKLSSGKIIQLGNNQTKDVHGKNDAVIAVNTGNELYYKHESATDDELQTLTTPKGGQYSLTLSDGTKVWLNAASSITYPSSFQGNERKVELTGEAYFEVAKNAARPFRVTSGNQTVEVLGTHFNINAYNDEPWVRTTLLEGKVKVTAGNDETFLIPGQQAQLDSKGLILNKDADIEESTAWRNGYFVFNHEHIESIMRKISRWYDVDVSYQGAISKDWFGGTVSRYENAAEVLRELELTGQIHFKIEGRRIIVLQ